MATKTTKTTKKSKKKLTPIQKREAAKKAALALAKEANKLAKAARKAGEKALELADKAENIELTVDINTLTTEQIARGLNACEPRKFTENLPSNPEKAWAKLNYHDRTWALGEMQYSMTAEQAAAYDKVINSLYDDALGGYQDNREEAANAELLKLFPFKTLAKLVENNIDAYSIIEDDGLTVTDDVSGALGFDPFTLYVD
jgi:hypothetical protein